MKLRIAAAVLGAAIGLQAGVASANAVFADRFISASGAGSVGYVTFNVTSAGVFDIFTTSASGPGGIAPIDPQIHLFAGSLAAPAIAADDDSCPFAQCGGAVAFLNSLINNIALGVGTYIVAVSDFFLSEAEAIAGLNDNDLTGTIRVNIEAVDGGEVALAEQVPEPASLALLGAGLVALGALRRRRG